jgi:hypothetical protein
MDGACNICKNKFPKQSFFNIQSILKIWTILSKELKITSSIHMASNLYRDRKKIMIQSKVFNEQNVLRCKVCM